MKHQKTDIDQLYKDYRGIIYERVWTFFNRFGGDFDELEAEGNLLFCKAARNYKEKGKAKRFSTFLYRVLTNGLVRFTCKENKWKMYTIPIEDIELSGTNEERNRLGARDENPVWFGEFLESLSEDAQAVLQALIEEPQAVLGLAGTETPRRIRAVLANWLVQERGVSLNKRWVILREIENAVTTQGE